MKPSLILLALILFTAGCVVVNNKPPAPPQFETPPPPIMPMRPKPTTADIKNLAPIPAAFAQVRLPQDRSGTRPTERRVLGAGTTNVPPTRIPVFIFKTNGNFRVEASTNLTAWWSVAEVYGVTNITIVSKTVSKRPYLFYRLTKL